MRGHPRLLLLLRHAKAEPYGQSDAARRLTDRGRRQAAAVGARLRDLEACPDVALVSPTARTQETWRVAAAEAGCDVEPRSDAALYSGGPEQVLEVVRTVDASAEVVVVVGHNPTIGYLAQMADDGEGDPDAFAALVEGFPPSSLGVFGLDAAWGDLSTETLSGRLLHFWPGE